MTMLRTLDELSPVETAEEALSSPVGAIVLIAVILLLAAAVVLIVFKTKKKNAKAESTPAANDKTDDEAP